MRILVSMAVLGLLTLPAQAQRIDARDGAAIKDVAVLKITAIEDSEVVMVDTP
jgi:hypothetical protein